MSWAHLTFPRIGFAHRQAILGCCRPGGHLVEWGTGWSTPWFAERLPPGARVTSIDHDPQWHERIAAHVERVDVADLRLVPPAFPIDAEAVLSSEDPTGLEAYIGTPIPDRPDAVLVDGVARGAVLLRLAEELDDATTVFLHDAQRDWYDEAKAAWHCHGVIGSCPEYPGPQLWYGGRTPAPPQGHGELPMVVSYYTTHTPYESLVPRFTAACARLGLEHEVVPMESRGTWEANCATKAGVCLDVLRRHRRPILWVDIDAEIVATPEAVRGLDADFAIHRHDDWEFATGTVYLNHTVLGLRLCEEWHQRCVAAPDVWDQVHLDRAWERLTAEEPLHTRWLPRSYYAVTDDRRPASPDDVVRQYQASRALKSVVGAAGGRGRLPVSTALVRARQFARTRRRFTDALDSFESHAELFREFALERPRFVRNVDIRGVLHGNTIQPGPAAQSLLHARLLAHQVAIEEQRGRVAAFAGSIEAQASRLLESDPGSTMIFGAGEVGLLVADLLAREGRPARGFVESDPFRWGERFRGLEVLPLAEALASDCTCIIVASFGSGPAIARQIEEACGQRQPPRTILLGPAPAPADYTRLRKWVERWHHAVASASPPPA